MSFTLMRFKDGKPAPIRLSIWDAFKGAPPPKPRPHRCNLCNQLHKPESKHVASPETPAAETPVSDKKTIKPADDATKSEKPADSNEDNFTPEEDAKILALKAENMIWADIAKELGNGRHKNRVKARYGKIKDKDDTMNGTKTEAMEEKNEESPAAQMTKQEKKAAKAAAAKEQGLKRAAEAKAKEEAKGVEIPAAEAIVEPPVESEAPKPTKTQRLILPSVNEKQKWIAAASKHFDRTGQRITPEQARKMAEGTT